MQRLEIVLSRLVWLVPTLLGLTAIVFFIANVVPTDPIGLLAGESATADQVEALRVELGYDRPLYVQFYTYIQNLAMGNLGESIYTQRSISEDLLRRLPATLELTFAAILIAVAIGIPGGMISAYYRNSGIDQILRVLSVSGLAVASFWLALQLQMFFSTHLGLTPLNGRIAGFGPPHLTGFVTIDSLISGDWESLRSGLMHLLLPALTLSLPAAATILRFTRAGVLEVINSNFVLYEQAMGLPRSLVTCKYVLRNALIATVTQIGLLIGIMFSHAVVVEAVFDWPGLGTYAVHSILMSDYNAIFGFTILVGVVFIVINLIVDIVHTFIDPRNVR